MSTQLKDLKFGDYVIKGEDDSGSTHFVLGSNDSFGYMSGSGATASYFSIINSVGSGGIDHWEFHGVAEKANTVTCYNDEDPTVVAGTYKLLVNGSGAITATLVN